MNSLNWLMRMLEMLLIGLSSKLAVLLVSLHISGPVLINQALTRMRLVSGVSLFVDHRGMAPRPSLLQDAAQMCGARHKLSSHD